MQVKNKLNQFGKPLNDKLRLFLSISICIFLFILFFQPFPLDRFDFNDKLIFVSGIVGIVFLIIFLTRIILPIIIRKISIEGDEAELASLLSNLIILISCSVSLTFYLRYVGGIEITFHIMFKIVLICIAPPVILKVYDVILELSQQNETLVIEKRIIQSQVEKYEEDNLNKSIEFNSENSSDNFKIFVTELAFVKSADNYVEIIYVEGEAFKKKLIRNTLKNIELQLKPYSNFIRCHRICIVNMHFVEKLNRSFNNYWISIKGYEERIPVSRQYLLKLKEAI